jgi:hypothetical protein
VLLQTSDQKIFFSFLYGINNRRHLIGKPQPMSRLFTLSVPSPCTEKWESFSKTKQGGFCKSCQKQVIDFTSWSDEDIRSYFKNSATSTCGRFRQTQLTTYSIQDPASRSRFKWIPASIVAASLLLGARDVFAQRQEYPIGKTVQHKKNESGPTSLNPGTLELTGTVKGADSIPLPAVNIQIKGTTVGTVTDIDGSFRLKLSGQLPGDVVVVSFIGFETKEFSIYNKSHFDIVMNEDLTALGEMVIMGGCTTHWWSPRRTWWRVKRLFTHRH